MESVICCYNQSKDNVENDGLNQLTEKRGRYKIKNIGICKAAPFFGQTLHYIR